MKPLSYTVQHVVNGNVEDTFTEETSVQVLQPDTLVRNEELEADQNYRGYVKSGVAYADGSTVEGSEIANGATIIVSYKVDDTQMKPLSYTVQHVVNGNVEDTFTEETSVQVLQPDTLVRNEELEADRNYRGYVKSGVAYADGSTVEGSEIANGATIIVSYKVDNADEAAELYGAACGKRKCSGHLHRGDISAGTAASLLTKPLTRGRPNYAGYVKSSVVL